MPLVFVVGCYKLSLTVGSILQKRFCALVASKRLIQQMCSHVHGTGYPKDPIYYPRSYKHEGFVGYFAYKDNANDCKILEAILVNDCRPRQHVPL